MPELIAPAVRLHAAGLEAHEEWGPGLHEESIKPAQQGRLRLNLSYLFS
jgi:hypothetical protein